MSRNGERANSIINNDPELLSICDKLRVYAKEINEHRTALAKSYLTAGELLARAKEIVGHGNFGGFLEESGCGISHRMANYYMEAFDLQVDSQTIADLGLVEAIKDKKGKPGLSDAARARLRQREQNSIAIADKITKLARYDGDEETYREIARLGSNFDAQVLAEELREWLMDKRPKVRDHLRARDLSCSLFVDSGAWTAYTKGVKIDLDAYCDWLKANLDIVDQYAVLDHIDRHAPDEAARTSFKNFLAMRDRGLDPIPVFHANEDPRYLQQMLDAGCGYIGLGALSAGSSTKKIEFYESAWKLLRYQRTGRLRLVNGQPVKVHAFGETSAAILLRYPWASADSSSWSMPARVGSSLGDGTLSEEELAKVLYRKTRAMVMLELQVQHDVDRFHQPETEGQKTVKFPSSFQHPSFDLYLAVTSAQYLPLMSVVKHWKLLYSFYYINQSPSDVARFRAYVRDPKSRSRKMLSQRNRL